MIQRDRRKRSYTSQNTKKTPLRDNGTLLSQIPLLSQVLCDKRGILKFRRLQKSTVRYQSTGRTIPACRLASNGAWLLNDDTSLPSFAQFEGTLFDWFILLAIIEYVLGFLRPYTMISAVLPPLGFLETTICLSIRSFSSATWEMIPTRRLPSVRLARVL